MIKDFETVKKQLQELSAVINNFKSETVQLRILDLLFKGVKVIDDNTEEDKETPKSSSSTSRVKSRKRKAKKPENGEASKKVSSRAGKLGPHSAITQLLAEDFFKTKKTIGDIVEHCKNNLATTVKSNDISGKLASMVRDKKLKRVRNPDNNQYEYSNY